MLDTTPYDDEIAAAESGGDKKVPRNLGGGSYYLPRSVSLGDLAGPGRVVSAGNISVGSKSEIGDNITLIAGGSVEIKTGSNLGTNSLVYAREGIVLKTSGTVGSGSSLLTPADIDDRNGVQMRGILFAGGNVTLFNGATVFGAVIALEGADIKAKANITYDPDLGGSDPPPGLRPEIVATALAWEER